MTILASPWFTALISGALMFGVGFLTGQMKAKRQARLYLRIRGI